jgi:hypothetical protein
VKPAVLAAFFIAAAAVLARLSATGRWGHAAGADGSRIVVSPIGLVRTPAGGAAASGECRWWPEGVGTADLCAPSPNAAPDYRRLRAVYPLLIVAMWVGVAALFLQVLKVPRFPAVRLVTTWAVTLLTAAAVAGQVGSARNALAALAGQSIVWGAVGFWLAGVAVVLSGASGLLLLRADRRSA